MARGEGGLQDDFSKWPLTRLEQNSGKYLHQFMVHLATPVDEVSSGVETSSLGKVLLDPQLAWRKLAAKRLPEVLEKRRINLLSKNEQLGEIFCVLLEMALLEGADSLVRQSLDSGNFNLELRRFVGGFTLHVLTYLSRDIPPREDKVNIPAPLIRTLAGDNLVAMEGKSYRFRGGISITGVQKVITLLGDSFFESYVRAYVRLPELKDLCACLLQRLNPQQHAPDAIARNWSLDKRTIQDLTLNFRLQMGERVCIALREQGLLEQLPRTQAVSTSTGVAGSESSPPMLVILPASTPILSTAEEDTVEIKHLFDCLSAQESTSIEFAGMVEQTQKVQPSRTAVTKIEMEIVESPDSVANEGAIITDVSAEDAPVAFTEKVVKIEQEFSERQGAAKLKAYQLQWLYGGRPAVGATPVEEDEPPLSFIPPRLKYLDLQSQQTSEITWTQLCCPGRRLLLLAPPHGGKRRLQWEVAVRMTEAGTTFSLFVDLLDFAESGFSELYRYLVDKVADLSEDSTPVGELINDLHSWDLKGQLMVHLGNWDALPPQRQAEVARQLKPLHTCLLSTADVFQAYSFFGARTMPGWLHGVVEIMPFDANQVREYIEQYADLHEIQDTQKFRRLAARLPGLAALPGGLEHICRGAFQPTTIIEVLLDFIGRDWVEESPSKDVLETRVVKMTRAILLCMPQTAERMVPLATLEQLSPHECNVEPHEQQLLQDAFAVAKQGHILVRNADGETYRFVVPEIGYLFRAMAALDQVVPAMDFRIVCIEGARADWHQYTPIDMAYAAYRQENRMRNPGADA